MQVVAEFATQHTHETQKSVRPCAKKTPASVMDIAIQAVRAKTGRSLEGPPQSNDEFLRDVAAARGVYAGLESEGRGLTSEEVRPTRSCCMFLHGHASSVLAEMIACFGQARVV